MCEGLVIAAVQASAVRASASQDPGRASSSALGVSILTLPRKSRSLTFIVVLKPCHGTIHKDLAVWPDSRQHLACQLPGHSVYGPIRTLAACDLAHLCNYVGIVAQHLITPADRQELGTKLRKLHSTSRQHLWLSGIASVHGPIANESNMAQPEQAMSPAVRLYAPSILDLLHLLSPPHQVDGLEAVVLRELDDLSQAALVSHGRHVQAAS